MRIPLDYYRILSVPVKATSAQLEQAYHDRLLQQPRREYSDQALEARQQLIQYSYQVLSDQEQRTAYDAQFLRAMQPMVIPELEEESESEVEVEESESANPQAREESKSISVANPTIEISEAQIVGALLIFHELGEYETVLSIGIDDFNHRELAKQSQPEEEVSLDTTQEDLILVLTLAYMELGREQWHRREYENAALSSQLGIDLLNQKSLFPHIQEELEQDLSKLRPYRVLELISQNPTQSAARAEGFKLLQSMLLQRQGIEGKGEDRSGLNFDQFLCFVQQLRTYLTSTEQQELFDSKSQEKSAIANYLAVYALLGRGFSLKKPELVLRAQRKLDYLSGKQDVSWEQAIAALLLGHTEKAIYKLKHAPDPSQLQQVQQHSLGSSDLLPGLCFYGEKWLLEDVLAQFSDLEAIQLTLKEYFADREVQAYLEELSPPTIATPQAKEEVRKQATTSQEDEENASSGIMSLWRNMFSGEKSTVGKTNSLSRELDSSTYVTQGYGLSTATMERSQGGGSSSLNSPPRKVYPQTPPRNSLSLPLQPKKNRAVPPSVVKKVQGKASQRKASQRKASQRKKLSPATLWKGRLFVISLILGVGTIGYWGMKLFLSSPSKTMNQARLAISLNEPSVEMPSPTKKPKPVVAKPKPKLTFTEQSQQVIQTWLSSKSAAFGEKHQIERLSDILAEPLLTTWQERAATYQQENLYREYDHSIVMRSAKINLNDQNKGTVEAEVKETAKHYQSGQLDNAQSYDDNLLVRYQLIRQGEKWLIYQAEVLETL